MRVVLAEIPGFELGRAEETDANDYHNGATPPSPARSSVSSTSGSRRGSESSEKNVKVEAPGVSSGDDDDDAELQDEESESYRYSSAWNTN
jgi:hypothetical protein